GQPTVSSPASVPVPELNLSVSMPSRWSRLTNRLHSGGGWFGSKARCWPCLKPPPASSTGRFLTEWLLPSPRVVPREHVGRSSNLAPSSRDCFSLTSRSRSVLVVSTSTILSWSSLLGSLP